MTDPEILAERASFILVRCTATVKRSARLAWAAIGAFADAGQFLDIACVLEEGDGGIGSVRRVGNSIVEVMVGETRQSYTYVQTIGPMAAHGYHGCVTAEEVDPSNCLLIYTLAFSPIRLSQEEQTRERARLTARFQGAVDAMARYAATAPGARGTDAHSPTPITVFDDLERVTGALVRTRADLGHAMQAPPGEEVFAMIAHELNQPLAAVQTYSLAARRWLDREPANVEEARAALGDVIAAAGTAGEVVENVRSYLTRKQSVPVPVVVDEMIEDAMQLVARELSEGGVELLLDLHAGDASVLGNRNLLQKSILNLALNAIAAINRSPSGQRELSIRSEVVEGFAIVTVSDTGPGFSKDIVGLGTDALFSTRQGGLADGIAVCRSTVLAHEGEINFANRTSKNGAQVRLSLPLSG